MKIPKRTYFGFYICIMSKKARVDEMTNRVRSIIEELKNTDVSNCEFDISGSLSDSDYYDDKLSCVSDISSVASFELTPLKSQMPGKKNQFEINFNSNKNKQSKNQRQSRIPVPSKTKKVKQDKISSNSGFMLAKPISCPNPVVEVPTNFLAPSLSDYSHACVCIFEGADFPRSRNGERSTYVVLHLHPELPPIRTPICFNKTTNAVYNGGFDLNVIGIDFSSVVPVAEVFDFITEEQNELLGTAFIQLNMAKKEDDVCVILHDEWIDVYTVNTRLKCGKIKMTLVFHNETDISQYVTSSTVPNSVKGINQNSMMSSSSKPEKEKKPMLESIAVQKDPQPKIENSSILDNLGDFDLSYNAGIPSKNTYSHQKNIISNDWKISQFDDSPIQEKTRENPFTFSSIRRAPIILPSQNQALSTNYNFQNEPPVKLQPRKVFADEGDLTEFSEDLFSSNSSSASKQNFKKHENNSTDKQVRVPLQPVINNTIPQNAGGATNQDSQQQRRRFARYSDFNWH